MKRTASISIWNEIGRTILDHWEDLDVDARAVTSALAIQIAAAAVNQTYSFGLMTVTLEVDESLLDLVDPIVLREAL